MKDSIPGNRADRFFTLLVRHPWQVLLPLAAVMMLSMFALKHLSKDTRSDAFLAPDNPALVYRELIRERFGLSDPLLIALVAADAQGIYRPDILADVAELTDKIKALPNVDANNVISLATESLITGSEFDIAVEPILDPLPASATEAAAVRAAVEDFPLLLGSLVAKGGEATLIVVQLLDEQHSEKTYNAIRQLLAQHTLPPGVVAHVAGEGAITGYLGAYIDADARLLNPLAGLIIFAMIAVAFQHLAPAMLALVIILATLTITLGSMAAFDVSFYVITNALPVILIGISVADAIHICSHYFELQNEAQKENRDNLQGVTAPRSSEELVVETMVNMWQPVTVTFLTTAAGFLGLYLAADMPPFKYFGLFAALGVAVAWLYSMMALPPLMVLAKLQVHPHFVGHQRNGFRYHLGWITRRPRPVVLAFCVLCIAGAWGSSRLVVDDDRIRLFHPDEVIAQADRAINRHFNGTTTLDVVIETGQAQGLYEPAVLRRIEALQAYAQTLPHVTGSSSIVDYLKQINRVVNDGDPAAYVLPESRETVAQYLLLYSFSADPADLAHEIDFDHRAANVRLTMDHGGYVQIAPVVEALEAWLEREFSDVASATLSGRASLNYHWVRSIGESHLAGLLIALLLVWAVASLSYRSAVAGVYTMVPVVVAVLLVYGFMAMRNMSLGVGTSMFAAVAIGLGVDFSIHTISRLQSLYRESEADDERIFYRFLETTGRALLFNVITVASGFGVLMVSQIAQLSDFGSIVMLSMGVSFVASVTLLPALIILLRPGFITKSSGIGGPV